MIAEGLGVLAGPGRVSGRAPEASLAVACQLPTGHATGLPGALPVCAPPLLCRSWR